MKTNKKNQRPVDAKQESQHTPTQYDLTHLAMVGPDGIPVFLIPSATPDRELNERRKHERARIVRVLNSHEALLEAAYRVIKAMYNPNDLELWLEAKEDIHKAIAQAESKSC